MTAGRYETALDAYDGGEGSISPGMWAHMQRQVLQGKRGQHLLHELEDYLLAMPRKRLIHGDLMEPVLGYAREWPWRKVWRWLHRLERPFAEQPIAYDVCLVGCFVAGREAAKGNAPASVFGAGQWEASWWETIEMGTQAGLGHVLAWILAQLNDDTWSRLTPEDRYQRALAWIHLQYVYPGSELPS